MALAAKLVMTLFSFLALALFSRASFAASFFSSAVFAVFGSMTLVQKKFNPHVG